MVGHWSVARTVTAKHLHFAPEDCKDNVIVSEEEGENNCTLTDYTWLVQHFSEADDTVAVFGSSVYCFAAALREGRNAGWITSVCDSNTDAEIIELIENKKAEKDKDEDESETEEECMSESWAYISQDRN